MQLGSSSELIRCNQRQSPLVLRPLRACPKLRHEGGNQHAMRQSACNEGVRPLRACPKLRQSSWRESTVERSAPPRLMGEAIRGALRSAIRGHQSQSVAINRNPWPSVAIRGHQIRLGFHRSVSQIGFTDRFHRSVSQIGSAASLVPHRWDRSSRGIWWCGRRGSRCRALGAGPWPRPSGT